MLHRSSLAYCPRTRPLKRAIGVKREGDCHRRKSLPHPRRAPALVGPTDFRSIAPTHWAAAAGRQRVSALVLFMPAEVGRPFGASFFGPILRQGGQAGHRRGESFPGFHGSRSAHFRRRDGANLCLGYSPRGAAQSMPAAAR